jgi:hypothetical protein
MILRRLTANLRAQNWTAIGIEFLIVVIGVFIGTQVANWNQARLEKQATQRMLIQLVPELRAEMEFFDAVQNYYRITRRYADRAAAGWNGERMSDSEFVIAAYQASQVNGIGINPDSWALTFGGEQLRNIEDPKLRRNLEVVLTSDYAPVEFGAVATPYREHVRKVIPIEIQDQIRNTCGDRNVRGNCGIYLIVLPARCSLQLDPAKAAAAAAALRAQPQLADELRWHLAAVATFLANAEILRVPMRDLHRQLSAVS